MAKKFKTKTFKNKMQNLFLDEHQQNLKSISNAGVATVDATQCLLLSVIQMKIIIFQAWMVAAFQR